MTHLVPGVHLIQRTAPDLLRLDVRDHFREVEIKPHEWLAQAAHVKRQGAGPGSLTDEGLEYHVLDGVWIESNEPALYEAYLDLAPAVSMALGKSVFPSEDRRSRININLLSGVGSKYELHTDSQPYTLILFATEHREGGQLMAKQPPRDPSKVHDVVTASYSGGAEWYFTPHIGEAVLFDGAKYPHGVLPLMRQGDLRVTIPMVFIDPDAGEVRPEGTDEHLYA